jgi:hypothetical protein
MGAGAHKQGNSQQDADTEDMDASHCSLPLLYFIEYPLYQSFFISPTVALRHPLIYIL